MASTNWNKIEELVQAALDVPPAERDGWLESHCNGNEALRAEVRSLLAVEAESVSFLNQPAVAKAGRLLSAEDEGQTRIGQQVGAYKVLSEIGRGGMGVVYVAERQDQFRQRVALKFVKRGLDTEDIVRRFRRERQILASLNHPNIGKLFDGGMTADNLPYFVMEYIEGSPLLQYCDEHHVTLNDRLRLFRRVCAAVQHAHQNLIIHRDLKPSNIMVTAEGMIKLLDFGVAKLLSADSDQAALTKTAVRVMTPEYASPEQVRGQRVTTATDVYSLGVILYELLTGVKPYKLKDTSPAELSRAICDSEPSKPSEALRDMATRGHGDTEKEVLSRSPRPRVSPSGLKGDLDNIVLMALRKEPERRYKSVEQFSEDIRRRLEGLPVVARKDTVAYRSSKFIQRNRIGVTAAVLVLLAIIGGLIATVWEARVARAQAQLAREQRDKAQAAQARAEKINRFMQSIFSYGNPDWFGRAGGRRDMSVLEAMRDVEKRVETEFKDEPDLRADVYQQLGDSYRTQRMFEDAERNLRQALRLRLEIYGEDSGKVAESMYILGGVRKQEGDHAEFQRLLAKALNIQRRHPNDGNDLPYMMLDAGGNSFFYKGDIAGALSLYLEALDIFRQRYGDEHPMVALAHTQIADLYMALGDYTKAEAQIQTGLKNHKKVVFFLTLRFLAELLINRGDYPAAELTIKQMLAKATAPIAIPEDMAMAYGSKSYLAYRQGNYALALAYDDKMLAAQPAEVNTRLNHDQMQASCLNKLGQAKRAESIIRTALEVFKQSPYAENLLRLASYQSVLGESLTVRGHFNEAETVLLAAYETQKARVLPQELRLVETRQRLVDLYRAWGKTDEAKKYEL